MLCFRVLLEACLFECLFSPLAFSFLALSREVRADCGVSGRLPRLPKWRDDETALLLPVKKGVVGNTLSTQNLNQRGATQVKTMSGYREFFAKECHKVVFTLTGIMCELKLQSLSDELVTLSELF